jgi:cyclic 2,3-diphosphoglycerate synthetase
VDGEHYPPVTRWGIERVRERGYEPVAALLLGGTEKLAAGGVPELGVPVHVVGTDPMGALADAIGALRADGLGGIVDLSDEPVLGYRERMGLASVALANGLTYLGGDFRLEPPIEGPPIGAPAVGVIGTGKRTGKTAIAGTVARAAIAMGLDPTLVAMGRGGPPAPQVAEPGSVRRTLRASPRVGLRTRIR